MSDPALRDPVRSGHEGILSTETESKLRELAAAYCEEEGGAHGPDHAFRVHDSALEIGRLMHARLEIISPAALLHDIGRPEESRSQGEVCHARRGAEMAAGILAGLGFPPVDIEEICHCIATHRFRSDNPPVSLEAKILFDADKLDSIGAIGIGRAFLFAGQVGARLHNHQIDIHSTDAYSVEDTAYREFRVKLHKVRERMLTPVGRKLADDRHSFMEEFFSRLESEITGRIDC